MTEPSPEVLFRMKWPRPPLTITDLSTIDWCTELAATSYVGNESCIGYRLEKKGVAQRTCATSGVLPSVSAQPLGEIRVHKFIIPQVRIERADPVDLFRLPGG
jgi:hypothetical protein